MTTSIHPELQYLNLCKNIIENGCLKGDRTGVGTRSIFGAQMRFNLRDQFPLLTTKQVHWPSVAKELLWMVSGSTDSKKLSQVGVRIWDANSSRQFLDNLGFTERREGDLGPVYGFQWRHFGAKYINCDTDYTGQGVDQLSQLVSMIKKDPTSRRLVMSAWNPLDLNYMALPPCHTLCQFYVADNELSCQLYQRSADLGLGVPFNIASYSLLTYMIAHICDLKVGDFVHTIGDAHIYNNHIEPLKLQIERIPYSFPSLVIKRKITEIDDFTYDDFEIVDYKFHPRIKMDMAV